MSGGVRIAAQAMRSIGLEVVVEVLKDLATEEHKMIDLEIAVCTNPYLLNERLRFVFKSVKHLGLQQ